MHAAKLKNITRIFLIGPLLCTATSAMVLAQDKRIADSELASWVDKRVQEWQPTKAERRFDEIGWVKDIREGERLAKEHGRPVFLFTHDGHMAIGRC